MSAATVVVRHVNIGTARRLRVGERSVLTGIGKAPVTGPVAVGTRVTPSMLTSG